MEIIQEWMNRKDSLGPFADAVFKKCYFNTFSLCSIRQLHIMNKQRIITKERSQTGETVFATTQILRHCYIMYKCCQLCLGPVHLNFAQYNTEHQMLWLNDNTEYQARISLPLAMMQPEYQWLVNLFRCCKVHRDWTSSVLCFCIIILKLQSVELSGI